MSHESLRKEKKKDLRICIKIKLKCPISTKKKVRKPHDMLRHLQHLHCELDRYTDLTEADIDQARGVVLVSR